MNNKEIIYWLNKNRPCISMTCNKENADNINIAIDLAIKALERPTGYWKDHRWCSNCGCGIPTDVYGTSITEEEAHFCVECGARMEEESQRRQRMTELPQYHFDRHDFVRVWQSVFDTNMTYNILDMCISHTVTDNFELWCDEFEEYYIKYLPNGVTINWYKGTHLGRTNTCTDSELKLDEFENILLQLKRDICGGDKNESY